ncbi:hypothetical protein DV738_g5585, partial [Chaetothyriales sp. CBS 135597]
MASAARFLSLAPTEHALVTIPEQKKETARFLSLAPTEHTLVSSSTDEQPTEAIDIPVVQKTQRSSSSSTEEELSVSPTASSTDEPVGVVVDDKTRFLKLGN